MGILRSIVEKAYTWYNPPPPSGGGSLVASPYGFFDTTSDETIWLAPDGGSKTAEYLLTCPALTTIIGRKVQAFTNGKLEVLKASTDNYVRGRYKEWEELIKNPNPLQTEKQFRAQVYWYLNAYGFCPLLIDRPAGFGMDARPSRLWVLPPQFCKIKVNDKMFVRDRMDMIDEIRLVTGDTEMVLDKSNVFIMTDLWCNITQVVWPDSKLAGLKYPIGNLIKNYESRGTIAQYRGAIGILSNIRRDDVSTLPMEDGEKEALQKDYRRYGLGKDQWQLIITNASLQYQSMTMPVRDMMLLETEKADVMTIADALGYPSVLLASEKGTTYSNQDGAERGMYQNSIIPDSRNYEEQLMKATGAAAAGITIQYDYSSLAILQKDAKLEAQVRRETGLAVVYEFRNNVITWNEMKIALGQDILPGWGDRYFYQMEDVYGAAVNDPHPDTGGRVDTNGAGYGSGGTAPTDGSFDNNGEQNVLNT